MAEAVVAYGEAGMRLRGPQQAKRIKLPNTEYSTRSRAAKGVPAALPAPEAAAAAPAVQATAASGDAEAGSSAEAQPIDVYTAAGKLACLQASPAANRLA